ncbi:MAG: leucyl aminopeptidase [Fidelibacterota bacterium]
MAHLSHLESFSGTWDSAPTDITVFGIFEDGTLTQFGRDIDTAWKGEISAAVDAGLASGKSGKSTPFVKGDKVYLGIGLGKENDLDYEEVRKAGGTTAKFAISQKKTSLAVETFNKDAADYHRALAEGLVLGSYQFLEFQTKDDDVTELDKAFIFSGDQDALQTGLHVASAVCFSRDIDNRPGNITTPTRLAEEARAIAEAGGMKCTVFDRDEFTEMGMGGLAGVALGTTEPPKFIILEYFGSDEDEKPVVLVGKGLTFDSGGISLKPAERMDEMKFDMCGSGVVLGVMKAISLLKPKRNVIGIIPSTENLGGGKAMKPGDILTAYNGKTIEVLNTDAEGRLILADGLAYASKHYDPEYILDFATLTGAVLIALGHIATGIMGNEADLIDKVKSASSVTGEKVWEFPLWDEFCEQVKSKIADVKNVGAPRQAGTIAGGAFLKEFVGENIPWVHFDIAGTAWGKKENPFLPKEGASGEVIRLVINMLGL